MKIIMMVSNNKNNNNNESNSNKSSNSNSNSNSNGSTTWAVKAVGGARRPPSPCVLLR